MAPPSSSTSGTGSFLSTLASESGGGSGPSLGTIGLVDAFSGIAGGLAGIRGGFDANEKAKENARFLRERGRTEADEDRRQVRALIGAQRVAQAASGIDPGEGSAVDVIADTAAEGELRALRREFGFELEARQEEETGQAGLLESVLSGSGTILGAIGSEANRRGVKAPGTKKPKTRGDGRAGIGVLASDLNELRRSQRST